MYEIRKEVSKTGNACESPEANCFKIQMLPDPVTVSLKKFFNVIVKQN